MIMNKTPFAFSGKQMAFLCIFGRTIQEGGKKKTNKGTNLCDLICTFVIAVND